MEYKRVNIGLLMEQKMNELGLNKSEFAKKIGIPNQNVNRLFEKQSIDTDKLVSICESLDIDFFDYYRPIGSTSMAGNNAVANGDSSIAVSRNNNKNVVAGCGDAVLAERVKLLQQLIEEKDERIAELKERIEELKAK